MRTMIKDVSKNSGTVELKGWVHETRDHGKIRFLILRDNTGVIQVIAKKGSVPDEIFSNMSLPRETVVSISGIVKEEKQAPGGLEIVPNGIEVLNRVSILLPVDPTDRLVSDLDIRLDNRHIDLRRKKVRSIFDIQSEIAKAFREKAYELGIQEIFPTTIVGSATEGGAELFPIIYFDKEAFLSQSPQLYKQLAVIGGMEKVYMIVPYYRAEKHKTTAHINQFWCMDFEMGFATHKEAMDVLREIFLHILASVKKNCFSQLKTLGVELVVPKEIKEYTYTEVVEMLNKHGHKFEWGSDLGRDEEKFIYEMLKEEAYFITEYPTDARAFYTMPNPENPKISNSFDLMYRGLEMVSGSQRIHLPDLIIERLKAKGMNPENFEFYINAFRSGAPPHAGWAIGIERLTNAITRQPNIRECSMFPRDVDRIAP
ncbi:MAG: aspartate--tRNA(Asn) ligase [Candidatus Micrarchaeia archaeon]